MQHDSLILCRTLYRQAAPITPSLLFLYHTRTILSFDYQTKSKIPRDSRSHFSTSCRLHAPERNVFREFGGKTTSTREIPDSPLSTITAPERAIFDRIFEKLFNPPEAKSSPNDSLYSIRTDGDSNEDVTLESIFENAIREAKQRKESPRKEAQNPENESSKTVDRQTFFVRPVLNTIFSQHALFPDALQRSIDQAREKARAAQSSYGVARTWKPFEISEVEEMGRKFGEPEDEYEKLVVKMRKHDMVRVTAMLNGAKSDIELWRVLEKEVFSRMVELNKLLKKEEMAQKAAGPKIRGGTARKSIQLPTVAEVNTRPTAPTIITAESKPLDNESSLEGTSAATEAASLSSLSPHPLSILQTNYAPHLLHAVRLLRTHHPTSPYGPSILAHIKSLGSISYVLGASTALYNELLYIRWVHYRDLHACADLVSEMIEQGIGTDDLTRAVFRNAERSRRRAGKNIRDGVGGWETGWWQLQGVISGWQKWDAVQREAWRILGEERERVRREGVEREREEVEALGDGSCGQAAADVAIALVGDDLEEERAVNVHAKPARVRYVEFGR